MKILVAATLLVLATPPLPSEFPDGRFREGIIRVAKVLCPTGEDCPRPVALEVDGRSYPIDTARFFKDGELRALDGATVMLGGAFAGKPVGGRSKAIVEGFAPSQEVLDVLGRLEPAKEGGNWILTFAQGGQIHVDPGQAAGWSGQDGKQVWVTGRLARSTGPVSAIYLVAAKPPLRADFSD